MDEKETLEVGKVEEAKVVTPETPIEVKVESEPQPEVVEVIHEDVNGNVVPPTTEDEFVAG
jgi:hypothetical protein